MSTQLSYFIGICKFVITKDPTDSTIVNKVFIQEKYYFSGNLYHITEISSLIINNYKANNSNMYAYILIIISCQSS